MIESVINFLNIDLTALKIFQKVNGLCEFVNETQKDKEGTEIEYQYPAFYIGKDTLRYITSYDYKAGVLFHIMNGDVSESELAQVRIKSKRVERTYPIKAIAIIRRNIYNTDTAYSPMELLTNLQNKISHLQIPSLRTDLGVEKVIVNITNGSTDKIKIINEHFVNVNFPALHNLMAVQINYDIVISGEESCFNNYTC